MRKVELSSILAIGDYDKARPALRERVLKAKEIRRIHVGEHLTFLFENFETVHYQVQEMIRTERIVEEAQIRHEIDTYNELIGEQGELGCTLLIEIDDPEKRGTYLSKWMNLLSTIFIRASDGSAVSPTYDARQVGDSRISSVHYLRFQMGDKIPAALGCNHPDVDRETVLSPQQIAALCQDILAR
ncbi:DUF3501 family protein [bacterium]|nr:DUF3501 family protein [bacterium]